MLDRRTVLLLTPEYPPNVRGGLGTHVDYMTRELLKDFRFEIITEAGFRCSPPEGIAVHQIAVPKSRDFVRSWVMFCLESAAYVEARRIHFDYIHCHDWLTVVAAIILRAIYQKPLIFNIHLPQAIGISKLIEQLGVVLADAVVVSSKAVAEEVQRKNALPAPTIIPNGVDLRRFRPQPEWPKDDNYFLFVGRLTPQKGVSTMLLALSALQHRMRTRLVVVGDGHLELFLRRAARDLGISRSVDFVGWCTGQALVDWYQSCRALLVPSLYEPFGIVALEAMSCGRPVVASAVDGLGEIVEDGVNGYLVEAGDHLSLAAAILKLTTDDERYRLMAGAARKRATCFGWDGPARQTAVLLHSKEYSPWSRDQEAFIAGNVQHLTRALQIPSGTILSRLVSES